jgi:DNA-binding NarL/FixJ family response regulator
VEQPILVVDDDAGFREFATTVLGGAGYRIACAETGAAALALAEETRPRAVLLDVMLPDISGHEVLWQLRRRFGSSPPVLYVSGHRCAPADLSAGLMLGADDYLVKPVSPDELLSRIRRFLGENGATASAPGGLTPRELEVACALARGLDEAGIAAELTITRATVATHIQRILAKLGVHSRAQAVAWAHEHDLVRRSSGGYARAEGG